MTKTEALEALRKKRDDGSITEEEQATLDQLEANAEDDNNDGEPKTYTEEYVRQLRKENEKRRKQLRDIEKQMERFSNIDPEEYKELKDLKEKIEQEQLIKQGDFEKLRQKLLNDFDKDRKKYAETIEGLQKQNERLEAEIRETILNNIIINDAINAGAFNPDVVALAIKKEARVEVDDNGNRTVCIYDETGQIRANGKTGKPISIADRIAEMKQDEKYAFLFKGGIQGAGSTTTGVGGTNFKNPFSRKTLNLTEQGRIYKEDPKLAARLRAEAEMEDNKI